MLAIGVHRHHNLAARYPDPAPQGGAIALVAQVPYDARVPTVARGQVPQDFWGFVLRAVVDGDDLKGHTLPFQRRFDAAEQVSQQRCLLVDGQNYRYPWWGGGFLSCASPGFPACWSHLPRLGHLRP